MDALFANHLLFIRRHRGDYTVTDRGVYIVGETPGLTSWVPLKDDSHVPEDMPAVRLIPQSGAGWPSRLEGAGFSRAESLSYQQLSLDTAIQPRFGSPSISIRYASSDQDALAFAEIQIAGFLEQPGSTSDWWREFFPFIALRNYKDPQQDFLVGSVEGQDCAILLMVHTKDVFGIYAVATRPEFRGRGFSTALLIEAAEEARRRGSRKLILQANRGSFADGFYRRAGFEELYLSTVWRRQSV